MLPFGSKRSAGEWLFSDLGSASVPRFLVDGTYHVHFPLTDGNLSDGLKVERWGER